MMRKTLRASVLVLALCCPAFAGDMPCPTVVPTPEPIRAAQEPTIDSEIQNPPTDDYSQNGATATFLEVVLSLLTLP